MEPVSLTLSVFALFTFVDNGISALSKARNFKKQASKLRAKLLIEEARLHQWGRAWGYPNEDMDAKLNRFSPRIRDVVLVTLHEIATTLGDVDKMKSRYGLQRPLDGPLEEPDDQPRTITRTTTMPVLGSTVTESANALMLELAQTAATHALPSRTKVLSTGMWAIHGASKLESLIDDLKDWNNGLGYFQPPSHNAGSSLALAVATEVLDRENAETLEDIVAVAENNGPVILAETASLRQYSINLEEFMLTQLGNVTDLSLLLYRDRLKLVDSGSSEVQGGVISVTVEETVFGTYEETPHDSSSATNVLVEWKKIPLEVKPRDRFISKMRIQKLARLLHTSTKRPLGFRVLPALGMLLGDEGSYGLVFQTPQSGPGRHVRLHDLLPGTKSPTSTPFEPPLLSRIELSIMLCTSFIQLHTSSWLHKRFSSRNVLFFIESNEDSRLTLPEDTLSNPYITGFGFSRPAEDGEDSISLDASQFGYSIDTGSISALGDALYAHPASIGSDHVPFCREFDIYALGFVLLEIGLWTSLDALIPSTSRLEKLRKEADPSHNMVHLIHGNIMNRYIGKLRIAIGGVFEEATRWCLRGQFEDKSLEKEKLSLEFYWKVLWPLQQCKV